MYYSQDEEEEEDEGGMEEDAGFGDSVEHDEVQGSRAAVAVATLALVEPGRRRSSPAWARILRRTYARIERAEAGLLAMRNCSAMLEQAIFLRLADNLLQPPRRLLACLYSLLLYNVLAYCLGYARELLGREDWSLGVPVAGSSKIRHLALSATRIVLEWAKAVTFLVTVAFAVIVVSFEHQALQRYKPSVSYTIITWTYYMATEKNFIDIFPVILAYMEIEALENLENLYAPVILRMFTILLSALFVLIRLPSTSWCLLIVGTYFNIFLRCKELLQTYWIALQKERFLLNKYRNATLKEIKDFDDVCAVCLFPMKKSRVTPCQHLFHANCLRECIKASNNCPLCKQELVFT